MVGQETVGLYKHLRVIVKILALLLADAFLDILIVMIFEVLYILYVLIHLPATASHSMDVLVTSLLKNSSLWLTTPSLPSPSSSQQFI